jgi:hypothetical protein
VSDPVRRYPRGVWTLWPTFAGVAVHFGLREVLDPWLNASSDAKFWGAVTILALPLLFAVFALYRAIVPPQRR